MRDQTWDFFTTKAENYRGQMSVVASGEGFPDDAAKSSENGKRGWYSSQASAPHPHPQSLSWVFSGLLDCLKVSHPLCLCLLGVI